MKAPDHPEFIVGPPARPARRRFNLIVCLSLASIVFVGYWATSPSEIGKGYSMKSAALSDAKHLALNALFYANDSDDHLPPAKRWMERLVPYFPEPKPAYPDNFEAPQPLAEADSASPDLPQETLVHFRSPAVRAPGSFGFAFRKRLSQREVDSISNPSRIAMVFDSADTGWKANGGLDLLPSPGRYPSQDASGANAIAFVDGHTKALAPGDVRVK